SFCYVVRTNVHNLSARKRYLAEVLPTRTTQVHLNNVTTATFCQNTDFPRPAGLCCGWRPHLYKMPTRVRDSALWVRHNARAICRHCRRPVDHEPPRRMIKADEQ